MLLDYEAEGIGNASNEMTVGEILVLNEDDQRLLRPIELPAHGLSGQRLQALSLSRRRGVDLHQPSLVPVAELLQETVPVLLRNFDGCHGLSLSCRTARSGEVCSAYPSVPTPV
jgi:hypothetical protein